MQFRVWAPRAESLSVRVIGGPTVQMERSDDLTYWQPLTVVTNTTGLVEFAEPIVAGLGQHFYRALLLPSQ